MLCIWNDFERQRTYSFWLLGCRELQPRKSFMGKKPTIVNRTHLAKSCDFRSCSARAPVWFLCRRPRLTVFPAGKPVCLASAGPCIAIETEWPRRRPAEISRSSTFSTVAALSGKRHTIEHVNEGVALTKREINNVQYNYYSDGVLLLARVQPVHPPHFAVHRAVAQRESDREHPSFYLANVRENGRRYDLAVQAVQVNAAQTQHAAGQHDRVAGRIRLSYDPER